MEKFTPYDKLSKKEKKALDQRKRGTWAINPVTRKPEKPGAYNRAKTRKRDYDDSLTVSFFRKVYHRFIYKPRNICYSGTIKQGTARKGIGHAYHAASYQKTCTHEIQPYRPERSFYTLIRDCGSRCDRSITFSGTIGWNQTACLV